MLAAPIFVVYVPPLGLRLSISLRALFACVLSQRTEQLLALTSREGLGSTSWEAQ